jgi:hypothetical protein
MGIACCLFVSTLAAAFAQSAATFNNDPLAQSCSDAIYTTPARTPPKPVQAIRVGAAVFNTFAGLKTLHGLDKPTRALPFYTVKSPLTILAWARRGVTITIVAGKDNVALLYNREWLRRLGSWHYAFAAVPRSARLPVCTAPHTRQPLNTQYAGGFLLRKPGCVTIQVQTVGKPNRRRTTVPIGVAHC